MHATRRKVARPGHIRMPPTGGRRRYTQRIRRFKFFRQMARSAKSSMKIRSWMHPVGIAFRFPASSSWSTPGRLKVPAMTTRSSLCSINQPSVCMRMVSIPLASSRSTQGFSLPHISLHRTNPGNIHSLFLYPDATKIVVLHASSPRCVPDV